MLEFKPITIQDRAWIALLIKCEDSRSADASFGAMFLWNNEGPRFIAKSGSLLVSMHTEGENPLSFARLEADRLLRLFQNSGNIAQC